MKSDGQIGRLAAIHAGYQPYSWVHWESAVASGLAAHIPNERRRIYDALYVIGSSGHVEQTLNSAQAKLLEVQGQLGTLALPPRKIDLQSREQLLRMVELGSLQQNGIDIFTQQLLNTAKPLNVKPAELGAEAEHYITPSWAKACVEAAEKSVDNLPQVH